MPEEASSVQFQVCGIAHLPEVPAAVTNLRRLGSPHNIGGDPCQGQDNDGSDSEDRQSDGPGLEARQERYVSTDPASGQGFAVALKLELLAVDHRKAVSQLVLLEPTGVIELALPIAGHQLALGPPRSSPATSSAPSGRMGNWSLTPSRR